jgi:hypothetical protein
LLLVEAEAALEVVAVERAHSVLLQDSQSRLEQLTQLPLVLGELECQLITLEKVLTAEILFLVPLHLLAVAVVDQVLLLLELAQMEVLVAAVAMSIHTLRRERVQQAVIKAAQEILRVIAAVVAGLVH